MSETMADILIIDDEVGMREGCRRALIPHHLAVQTAEHGVEGLRKLKEGQFDLVLLDVMMPGMGGLELLDRIREHDPDIICIMITGYATVDLAAQAMKQGAYDFLPKPFTTDELLAVVMPALAEARRRKETRQQKASEDEALELERTRQETARHDAIMSRFMLVIVHELRNPAGVIKNYLQLMRAGYVEAEEWGEYLERLDGRAGQLLNMLDDLLELAHLKEILSPSKLMPVAVAGVLEEVTHKWQPVAEARGLDFQVQVEAQPIIMAQPAHLRSLWTNLVDNAIRYTPGGQVRVTLAERDGSVIGTVQDTGIGISPEELAYIFQEFYRSESARVVVELGTGLGLPIVNQIVKIYQGTIGVDSVLGQGSSFTFTLPLAAEHAAG
jgi:signal transduction histidine kinase